MFSLKGLVPYTWIKRTQPSRQWHPSCGMQFLGFLNSVDSSKKHLRTFLKCLEKFLDNRLFMYVRIYVYMYSNCVHIHICVFISFCHLLFIASCSVKHLGIFICGINFTDFAFSPDGHDPSFVRNIPSVCSICQSTCLYPDRLFTSPARMLPKGICCNIQANEVHCPDAPCTSQSGGARKMCRYFLLFIQIFQLHKCTQHTFLPSLAWLYSLEPWCCCYQGYCDALDN